MPPGRFEFAHPVTVKLLKQCGRIPSWAPVLLAFVNESHHVHLRAKQLDWLQGDVWPANGTEELDALIEHHGARYPMEKFSHSCTFLLDRTLCFYTAWSIMLQRMRLSLDADSAAPGMMFYARYLGTKDPDEPLLMQEAQFARLFRNSQAIRTGTNSSQCVCQISYQTKLISALEVFEPTFRFDHVDPGDTGDDERDAFAADVKFSSVCPQDETVWSVPWELLTNPPADQVLDIGSACLPMRILMGIACAQSALLHGMIWYAKESYLAAMYMLLFAVDCFDESIAGGSIGLLDLFAHMARLNREVNPLQDYALIDSLSKAKPFSKPRVDRLLTRAWSPQVAALPPLCLDARGRMTFSSGALPRLPHQGLRLQCLSGTHSLVPVEIGDLSGVTDWDDQTAFFMRVDRASWTNLGHALSFILPHIWVAFSQAFASGGLSAVWQRRARLRLYVALPGQTQEVLRTRHHAHLLPWLSLLSSEPPVFLQDEGQPAVDAATLPTPMVLAAQERRCHRAGIWGTPASPRASTKVGFDLFTEIARSFPSWQVDRQALVKRVWGRRTFENIGSSDAGKHDPCEDLAGGCIRVLVVTRGTFAEKKRRVANLDEAVRLVRAAHDDSLLRVAVVQMEEFTLQEEVALAAMTDVLVGTVGSAMWWAIFMPPGACVVWLMPKLTAFKAMAMKLDDPTKPVWTRSAVLEYKHHRDLWHVLLHGRSAPAGVEGNFEPNQRAEMETQFSTLEMDVFLDVAQFLKAFSDIVMHLGGTLRREPLG